MSSSRREFIKQFGIALASLLTTRCVPPFVRTCYAPAAPTPTPSSAGQQNSFILSPELERLRACWLELDTLAEQTKKDNQAGSALKQSLIDEHRAALDDLVRLSELSEAAAEQVQLAFKEAAEHVWAISAPVMCYKETALNYFPPSCQDLVNQAELLAENGDLDPDTVALAQTAIARDMAFLGLSSEETLALYDKIIQDSTPGTPYPYFEEIELDVPPEAAQAAQFLVALLVGDVP